MRYTSTTTESYSTIDREEIQYTYCRDFNHISRYRGLRQVIHQGQTADRFVALETTNPVETHTDINYYTVPANYENRLDIIAKELLGAAEYKWVIAYFNGITDGFTVRPGMTLRVPKTVSALFEAGEVLAPVSAIRLNLSSE